MNPKAKIEYYRRHFEQYCNDQLKISTPNPGEMLPLKLNVPQQMLLERIEAQRKELGYIRYCCCKSRQSTMSTFAQALCFHATATTKQFYALLIANDKDTTKDIFAMSSRFVVHLDDDVRPMTDRSSIQEIVFQNPDKRKRFENPGLGSRIVFQCATNITAGTGGTRHAVHLSELSKWERSSVELLFSSILPGLHLRPGTIGIKESTPYVGGDAFREMCEDARNKRGDDVWCFIPWFCDPQNAVPLKEGEKLKLDTEEKRIERLAARGQKKDEVPPIEMRPEQFKWRRKKILDLKSDTMFAQEYPVDFSSGWICLDSQIFDDTIMRESKKNVRFPRRFVEVHPGPQVLTIHKDDGLRDVRSELDYIAIWEEPRPSVTYDIGVDVSVGGRDENDWSVAEVVRRDNREQVAEVHLHIDPLDFGTMLYWLGKFYNTAQLIVEMNGPGFATHGQLSSMAYEYIYIWRHRERDVPTHSTYRGWKTQHDSKQLMVSNTVNAFNHKELIIHSRVLWDEMHEYVQIDPGVFRANSGHDDAITALMIAIQGGKDETFGDDAKEARAQAVDQNEQREQNVALRDDVFAPQNDHGLDAMVQELRGV